MITVQELHKISDELFRKVENRMRPKQYSKSGFLDKTESLKDVAERDETTLKAKGLTYDIIAERLSGFIKRANQINNDNHIKRIQNKDKRKDKQLRIPKNVPIIGGHLSNFNITIKEPDNKYLVQKIQWNGWQCCPFGPGEKDEKNDGLLNCKECSDKDFVIKNLTTDEYVSFPSLIIHLIRDHHFFEGNTEYRLDPEKVISVLNINPSHDYTIPSRKIECWSWECSTSLPEDLEDLNIRWFDIDKEKHIKGLVSNSSYCKYDREQDKDNSVYLHVACFEFESSNEINNDSDSDSNSQAPPKGFKTFPINVENIYEVDGIRVIINMFERDNHFIPYIRYKKNMRTQYIF
jgi:hypothetical protein